VAEEKNFENKVKKFLKDSGCWILKYWGGASYTKSGIPDLLVCCNGYFLGIELKSSKGTPSELQKYHIREIRKAGGIALVLYPDEFEEFEELIEELNSSMIQRILSKINETFKNLFSKGDKSYGK
jgi:Holliday junction resolvase - archaeal type